MRNVDNIDQLITEYNQLLPPFTNFKNEYFDNKIKIVHISNARLPSITKNLVDILKVGNGDEILYILDEKGFVNIIKSIDNVKLKNNEKFLSSSRIGTQRRGNNTWLATKIPRDIIDIIGAKNRIIFILYDNKLIIRNNFLSDSCIISGMILTITDIFSLNYTTIPIYVRDIIYVDIGDIIILVMKNCNVIVKSFADFGINIEKLEILEMTKIHGYNQFHLRKEILDFINPVENKILWIFDKNGDIILKNTVLPLTCI